MPLLNVIEWTDESSEEIVHKYDTRAHIVKRGSALTVREGQVVVFCDKGRMADVFLPGYYKLKTDTLPILTALLSWKYAFESPFKSDIYFVSTRQFVNCKWGTATPVILRDKDYGTVRVRGFGTYSFRVKNAYVFLTQLSGARDSFNTEIISDYIRSILVMGLTDTLGMSGVSVADMAGNLTELSAAVLKTLSKRFESLGLELSSFHFEGFSLPDEVQKALDENVRLGVLRDNADIYAQIAQADALREAAKNPNAAGTLLSAGIGLSMGRAMGESIENGGQTKGARKCLKCGSAISGNAKFCSECGAPVEVRCEVCGASVAPKTKFCPQCGQKLP